VNAARPGEGDRRGPVADEVVGELVGRGADGFLGTPAACPGRAGRALRRRFSPAGGHRLRGSRAPAELDRLCRRGVLNLAPDGGVSIRAPPTPTTSATRSSSWCWAPATGSSASARVELRDLEGGALGQVRPATGAPRRRAGWPCCGTTSLTPDPRSPACPRQRRPCAGAADGLGVNGSSPASAVPPGLRNTSCARCPRPCPQPVIAVLRHGRGVRPETALLELLRQETWSETAFFSPGVLTAEQEAILFVETWHSAKCHRPSTPGEFRRRPTTRLLAVSQLARSDTRKSTASAMSSG